MRRSLKFFAIALLLCALSSCSIEKDVTPKPVDDTPKTSYTILYYTCCSGLDRVVEPFFIEVGNLNVPKHINVVGQVKWTYGYKSDSVELADGSGDVQRFVFDHNANKTVVEDFATAEYRVDDADNLAEFIAWARETAPADEYIMVFCGHGNAYHPAFDDVTRGILRDDQFTSYLGIGDISEAFEKANLAEDKFALTMMVSCLMNTLEYSTELVPYTDYYLASGHVTVSTSRELYSLIEALIEHGQDEKAIESTVQSALVADYATLSAEHIQDTTLAKSVRIKKLNENIKSFVNRVCALYEEQVVLGESAMQEKYGFTAATIDEALAGSYYYLQPFLDANGDVSSWYQCSYNYDIVDIVTRVAEATGDEQLLCHAADVKEHAEEAILYQHTYNLDRSVFHAVTLVNSDEWEELRFEDANYGSLAFDKATGWSRLLKLNRAEFKHDAK